MPEIPPFAFCDACDDVRPMLVEVVEDGYDLLCRTCHHLIATLCETGPGGPGASSPDRTA